MSAARCLLLDATLERWSNKTLLMETLITAVLSQVTDLDVITTEYDTFMGSNKLCSTS